jgi:hypothetical protein
MYSHLGVFGTQRKIGMAARNDFETFNIPSTGEAPTLSRRRMLLGTAGVALGVMMAGLRGGGEAAHANSTAEETPVPAEGDEVAMAPEGASVANMNLYAGMEYADPHQLIGMSEEELVERGTILMDDEKSPEELMTDAVNNLQLLLTAGNTENDKQTAAAAGVILPEYANQTYRTHLHNGMFGPYIDTSSGGGEGMAKFQEIESFSSGRFMYDSRYITSLATEGITIKEVSKLGSIAATLNLKLTSTFPEGLGADPEPYAYDIVANVVLGSRNERDAFVVNLESFEWTPVTA